MTNTRGGGDPLARQWGDAIRRQRQIVNKTQKRLADDVGATQSAVSQWEQGWCAPTPRMQLRIANALGIDARLLFAYPQEVA